MEQQTHKAHRPAQSGAKADKKAKEKQKSGFNEKVCLVKLFNPDIMSSLLLRPLRPSLADEPRDKVVGTQSAIRLVYMFPWWTGLPMTYHHPSLLQSWDLRGSEKRFCSRALFDGTRGKHSRKPKDLSPWLAGNGDG